MRIKQFGKWAAHLLVRSTIRAWASLVVRTVSQRGGNPLTPRRILLINGAHVGDLVISTGLLPVLRSAYPEAEFGFLTGSWSSMVVENHPEIAYTHRIDHWRLNRPQASFTSKLRRYWKTRKVALREIRELKYDLSLSLHSWFPDFIHLAWQAGIPNRVGYSHSWFAPFATLTANLPEGDFIPQGVRIAAILNPLRPDAAFLAKRHPVLAPSTRKSIDEVTALLGVPGLENTSYRVIHMGSGEPAREMPTEFWREIATTLSAEGILFFTGRGEKEERQIETVIEGLPNCVSACNRLSWEGFVTALRYSKMVYGVESMAGHVAAAVGTPCTVVYTGTAGVGRWHPEGEACTVFTQHVACAPCGRTGGCEAMTCTRSVTPLSLLDPRYAVRTPLN